MSSTIPGAGAASAAARAQTRSTPRIVVNSYNNRTARVQPEQARTRNPQLPMQSTNQEAERGRGG